MSIPLPVPVHLAAWIDATATHSDIRADLLVPRPMPPRWSTCSFFGELRHHFLTATGHLRLNIPMPKREEGKTVHVTVDSHGTLSTQHATVSLDVLGRDLDGLPEEATIHLTPDENGVMTATGNIRAAADTPLGRGIEDTPTLERRLREQLESKLVEVQDLHVSGQAAGSDTILHVTLAPR